jgi:hypothetical protein
MPPRKRRKRAKPKTVARVHAVRGILKVHELSKAGTSLNLEILERGEKIGELEIGRGSLFWRGGKRHGRKRIRWARFAELMDKLAYDDA